MTELVLNELSLHYKIQVIEMLYLHAHTPIENELYRQLKTKQNHVSQLNIHHLHDKQYLERHHYIHPSDTLMYSFLDYASYDYLPSFQKEVEAVDLILEFAEELGYKHLIFITYPGVYYNSGNLFSQHKAIIQQKVAQSGLGFTFLAINALSCFEKQQHSLYPLCYNSDAEKFIIPFHRSKVIYNLEVENLVRLLSAPNFVAMNKSYEVFDAIYSMNEFLSIFSDHIPVTHYPNFLFSFLSYIRDWHTPSMVELLTKPLVTMQRNLVERDFHISLQPTPLVNSYLWRLEKGKRGFNQPDELAWNGAF